MSTACMTVALAGNPNSGKTTIFNNITGARQHVGNYAGVTVERREGFRRFQGQDLLLVDLPGTYSLTANSLDEIVARNVIIDEKPDLIVNILDAANLERNLYLALQLLELERPLVLALNMTDMAEKAGIKINSDVLRQRFGVPVVKLIGNRNQGTEELLQTVVESARQTTYRPFSIDYGESIETAIGEVTEALRNLTNVKFPMRWLAIKLLENDPEVGSSLLNIAGGSAVAAIVAKVRNKTAVVLGEELEIAMAEARYRVVADIVADFVDSSGRQERTVSDRIDEVLTHRVLGLPLFFGIMWLLFNIVFTVGEIPQGWIEDAVKGFSDLISPSTGAVTVPFLVLAFSFSMSFCLVAMLAFVSSTFTFCSRRSRAYCRLVASS